MLWLNAFALNLQRSVKMLSVEQTDPPYLDVKIEAIMFRVSIFSNSFYYMHNSQYSISISDIKISDEMVDGIFFFLVESKKFIFHFHQILDHF